MEPATSVAISCVSSITASASASCCTTRRTFVGCSIEHSVSDPAMSDTCRMASFVTCQLVGLNNQNCNVSNPTLHSRDYRRVTDSSRHRIPVSADTVEERCAATIFRHALALRFNPDQEEVFGPRVDSP